MGAGRNYDSFSQFVIQKKTADGWKDVAFATSLEAVLMQEDDMHEITNTQSPITTRIMSEWKSGKRYFVVRDYLVPQAA